MSDYLKHEYPFSVAFIFWKPDDQNNESQQRVVFSNGNPMLSIKALNFLQFMFFECFDRDDLEITQKLARMRWVFVFNFGFFTLFLFRGPELKFGPSALFIVVVGFVFVVVDGLGFECNLPR